MQPSIEKTMDEIKRFDEINTKFNTFKTPLGPGEAHILATLLELFAGDRLVLSPGDVRGCGTVADAFGADAHATVADPADKEGVTKYIPHRILVEGSAFGGEIALFVQLVGDLGVGI